MTTALSVILLGLQLGLYAKHRRRDLASAGSIAGLVVFFPLLVLSAGCSAAVVEDFGVPVLLAVQAALAACSVVVDRRLAGSG